MIRFECDYGEGAHPSILQRLQETNLEQTPGYGEDVYCAKARETIKKLCGTPKADVQFLVGGTQANLTVISAALRPHQGVVAAQSAHINVHETGSIEACGHKVLALPAKDGKIAAGQIAALCEAHRADASREHTVQPKMVYLSQPTELGTLYTRSELMAISDVCRANGLYLFVDGARLGYGIARAGNDVSFGDLGTLCDVFYIGGTKQGALFGEAVVLVNPALQEDFRYLIKQKGGMLAKGRLLGLQFSALLEEQAKLYLSLSRHADRFGGPPARRVLGPRLLVPRGEPHEPGVSHPARHAPRCPREGLQLQRPAAHRPGPARRPFSARAGRRRKRMSMPFARTSTAFVVRRNPSKILAVFPGECPQKAAVSLDFGRGLRYNFYGESFQLHFFTPGLPNSAWEFSRL